MKQYDHLVILNASPADEHGRFQDITDDGIYLGGQLRMEAGALAAKQANGDVIVVGGGIEAQDPKEKWRKVHDMAAFLSRSGVDPNRVIQVSSQADTLGNLRALYVAQKPRLKGASVGLLTNEYHLPRAMLIATDPQFDWDTEFIPVSAESHVSHSTNELEQYSSALALRLDKEAQGIEDWAQGTYRRQELPEIEWLGETFKP